MKKTSIHKKVAAFAVALALSVGVFSGAGYHTAHAESGSSHSSVSSMSDGNLIALLQDLIKLLELRLQALIEAQGGTSVVDDSDDDSDDDSSDDDSCDDGSSDDTGLTELDADIFTNETVVEIEIDGDKEIFVTEADTRAEIIDAILDEYESLSEDEVDDMLTVEEEDRASRASDKTVDSDDDSSCEDDDDEDEDEDDDDDDDHHGHGNDDDDDDDEDEDDDD